MRLGTIAAAVSLVNGAWLVYAGSLWRGTFFFPVVTGQGASVAASTNPGLLGLGVVLIIVSLVCFLNWTKAFYGSAILSALGILYVFIAGPSPSSAYFETVASLFSLVLAALTIALDLIASRRRTVVREEDHPLNLPVFG